MRADALGLPITLDVEGARVIVVGDDEDAARKQTLAREAGADVTALPPDAFADAALDGARLVLYTGHDAALAARISQAARQRGALVWCSDDPARSDFAMPALARLGLARLAITTAGAAPALASRVRQALEAGLGETFARFVAALGALRAEVQRDEPDFARRRARLTAALDGFVLEVRARYPDWFA